MPQTELESRGGTVRGVGSFAFITLLEFPSLYDFGWVLVTNICPMSTRSGSEAEACVLCSEVWWTMNYESYGCHHPCISSPFWCGAIPRYTPSPAPDSFFKAKCNCGEGYQALLQMSHSRSWRQWETDVDSSSSSWLSLSLTMHNFLFQLPTWQTPRTDLRLNTRHRNKSVADTSLPTPMIVEGLTLSLYPLLYIHLWWLCFSDWILIHWGQETEIYFFTPVRCWWHIQVKIFMANGWTDGHGFWLERNWTVFHIEIINQS